MSDTAAQPAIHLDQITQVALNVTDLPAAKHFYGETLGMRFLFDAGTMTFFQCGSIRLMVGASHNPPSPHGPILYFKVPDIHLAHTTLKSQGVTFIDEPHLVARMKSHDLWLVFFKDPAGNTLALMSEAPHPE